MRATLTEGKKAGAVDFFVGGDVNIEVRLGSTGEDLRGLGVLAPALALRSVTSRTSQYCRYL